jgi:amino acid transporter
MQSATLERPGGSSSQPQLKKDAIGFWSTLTVGIASPAPAYTAAATLAGAGMLVATAGLKSPAILLLGFIPLLLVAASFSYLNRAMPDAGTAFTWSTKSLGPTMGFLTGWGMVISNTLVVGALAEVAAHYGFALLGLDALTESKGAVMIAAAGMMALGTWISARGVETSAIVEKVLIGIQVLGLVVLGGVALVRVALGIGHLPAHASNPHLDWFSPFGMDSSAMIGGLLLAAFIFWGWDAAVSLAEEVKGGPKTAGRAGIMSMVVLLGLYLLTTTGLLSFVGAEGLANADNFGTLGSQVLGNELAGKFILLVVFLASVASVQATILFTARTTFGMARRNALPFALARTNKEGSPAVATFTIGALAIVSFIGLELVSSSFRADSLAALGLFVAFYYGIAGLSNAVYFRKVAVRSVKNVIMLAVLPLVGAVSLFWVVCKSVVDLVGGADGTWSAVLNIQPPLVIAAGFMAIGGAYIGFRHLAGRKHDFLGAKPEAAPADFFEREAEREAERMAEQLPQRPSRHEHGAVIDLTDRVLEPALATADGR